MGAEREGASADLVHAEVQGLLERRRPAPERWSSRPPMSRSAGAVVPDEAALAVPGGSGDVDHVRLQVSCASGRTQRKPVPRGPRRNLRPVAVSMSQPRSATSTGNWPTDWVASRRKGTPAARATRPISAAGLTRPPLVGTWAMPDQLGALVDQVREGSGVELAGLVVGDDDDLGSGALGRLQVGEDAAAVLGPACEYAVARLERHGVERGVPGVGGVVEQRDLVRPAAHQLGRCARAWRRCGPVPGPLPRSRRSRPPAPGGRSSALSVCRDSRPAPALLR